MLKQNLVIGIGISLLIGLVFVFSFSNAGKWNENEKPKEPIEISPLKTSLQQALNEHFEQGLNPAEQSFREAYAAEIPVVEQDVSGVKMPELLEFAGEEVPLDIPDVQERLDREMLVNAYWHSNTILTMKLANKYFPEIEAVLEENGVPEDFKYLAVAESGLRNLVSPARATGFWQILKGTAQEYGLIVNNQIDERYDYVKSTEAACKYLLEAYEKFGSWTLAAASYNMGMGGVSQRLKEQQVENYYDLYLNTETSRYVFRILALKHLFINPEMYGFNVSDDQLYQPDSFFERPVTGAIADLAAFAKAEGTNYKTLKLLNPSLRSSSLSLAYGDTFVMRLPGTAPLPGEGESN